MRNFEKMTRKANRFDMEEVQKKGKKMNKPVRDRASKRAAWEF